MRKARPGLPLVLLMLAGCGLLPSAQPQWVVDRRPLPACGEETVVRGSTDIEARQCLLDAFRAGEDAELISTEAGADGAKVTRYLRVHANGTIERFIDETRNPAGPGTWERETCGQMLSAEEVRDVWIAEVFVLLDCVSQPVP